mmetsp:Transcript_12440/g.26710  ORF Transcript_12440/g.26710 Transcript_12440/m.26710 type:complete len:254 (+) Transcript_12440:576-1337(+)
MRQRQLPICPQGRGARRRQGLRPRPDPEGGPRGASPGPPPGHLHHGHRQRRLRLHGGVPGAGGHDPPQLPQAVPPLRRHGRVGPDPAHLHAHPLRPAVLSGPEQGHGAGRGDGGGEAQEEEEEGGLLQRLGLVVVVERRRERRRAGGGGRGHGPRPPHAPQLRAPPPPQPELGRGAGGGGAVPLPRPAQGGRQGRKEPRQGGEEQPGDGLPGALQRGDARAAARRHVRRVRQGVLPQGHGPYVLLPPQARDPL